MKLKKKIKNIEKNPKQLGLTWLIREPR